MGIGLASRLISTEPDATDSRGLNRKWSDRIDWDRLRAQE